VVAAIVAAAAMAIIMMDITAATGRAMGHSGVTQRYWQIVVNKAGELHLVPLDEPHEYADDCWCLPEWQSHIEAFGMGGYAHNTMDGRIR
jgi:hypothetical protein